MCETLVGSGMNQRFPHHLKPLRLWGLNCKQATIYIQLSHISHVLYIPFSNLSYFRFLTFLPLYLAASSLLRSCDYIRGDFITQPQHGGRNIIPLGSVSRQRQHLSTLGTTGEPIGFTTHSTSEGSNAHTSHMREKICMYSSSSIMCGKPNNMGASNITCNNKICTQAAQSCVSEPNNMGASNDTYSHKVCTPSSSTCAGNPSNMGASNITCSHEDLLTPRKCYHHRTRLYAALRTSSALSRACRHLEGCAAKTLIIKRENMASTHSW